MRLSRGRVLLRSLLLLAGGAFMLWRAWEARAAGRAAGSAGRVLADRLALVEALVGALALLTGAGVLLSLRGRARRHSLHLPEPGGPPPPPAGGPPGPDRAGPPPSA